MTLDELLRQAGRYQITEQASRADRNSIFVCICGAHADGHRFAPVAYENGCRLFVAEHALSLPADAVTVPVPDTHAALAALACSHAGNPSQELAVIGITGTKGKTTTALLLAHILNASGVRCGYIGTNGIDIGDGRPHLTANTTPDAVTLQNALRDAANAGCRAVALEVSSQALKLGRVAGTVFDACIFTNLSPDHIGPTEHPDLADYAACKRKLFVDFPVKAVLCNTDDPFAETLLADTQAPVCVRCSMQGAADYQAAGAVPYRTENELGCRFSVSHQGKDGITCRLPLIGGGNVSNALLAMSCAAERFGIPLSVSAQALGDVRIAGRSEVLGLTNGALAVIDYAHNGVSLQRLLCDLREYAPERLIVLFGSVGERTELRRPELGGVADSLADLAILTSDNPAGEDPSEIIRDIAAGMKKTPHLEIPDRREAIRTAVDLLRPGDILVLAGKGHERYQLIEKEKRPFCERDILRELGVLTHDRQSAQNRI